MAIYQIESCTILHCLPFKVKKDKVLLTEGKWNKLTDIANLLFASLMISFFFLKLTLKLMSSQLELTEKLWYTGWSCMISCQYIYKVEYFLKRRETVLLFNAMLGAEKAYIKQGLNTIHKGWNSNLAWPTFSYMGCSCVSGIPLCAFALALIKPCMGIFALSAFSPCVNEELAHAYYFLTPIFGAVEYYFSAQLAGPGVLANIAGNYYIVLTIRSLLDHFIGRQKGAFNKKLKMEYREFQLYVGMSNVCLASVAQLVDISGWTILIVVGVYTAIKLYGLIPIPIFGLFVYLALCGLLAVNFNLKENGKIHKRSEEILEKSRLTLTTNQHQHTGIQRLIYQRDVKSMNVLKIKIGSSNFYEIKTPLEMLSLCRDLIINLLVIT